MIIWFAVSHSSKVDFETEVYIVQKGDTLWDIARRTFDGNINQGIYIIRNLNNLETSVIYPGQRLIVPAKGGE